MKRLLFALSLFAAVLLPYLANAQVNSHQISIKDGCNFADGIKPLQVTASDPSAEARKIIQEILNANPTKIEPKFILNVGNVPNAVAMESGGLRYIIYSEAFMESIKTKSRTSQAARFLLAHEVGHHVLNHQFSGKTKAQSFADELDADDFAAKVMARLGATLPETLAGIRSFDTDGESATHPDPSAREEVITVAWKNEIGKMKPGTVQKFPVELDQSAFANPWNLISTAKAEVDTEKITISFAIPQQYRNRKFRICLKSNDYTIIPESRAHGSVGGTGVNLPYSENVSIVWNYKQDKFIQSEAARKSMLRVYVFDMKNQPEYPSQAAGWLVAGAGVGATVFGITEYSKGLQIYNNEYKNSLSDADYERADKSYFRSQFIMAGGIALLAGGAWIIVKKSKLSKEVTRSICGAEPRWHFEPWIGSDTAMGLSARFVF